MKVSRRPIKGAPRKGRNSMSAGVGDFVPGTDVVLVNRRKGYTCELLSRAEGSDLLFYAKATRRGFLVVVR